MGLKELLGRVKKTLGNEKEIEKKVERKIRGSYISSLQSLQNQLSQAQNNYLYQQQQVAALNQQNQLQAAQQFSFSGGFNLTTNYMGTSAGGYALPASYNVSALPSSQGVVDFVDPNKKKELTKKELLTNILRNTLHEQT